ncbi:HAD-IA family hydrolase [Dactylosporangium sp. CA-092794]|uniref:HAD-IA family hydrolase n=1 Tax=Dactylosporangium sp. CA-092794 TaxID=3239929 RepID=UPI003D8D1B89
MRRFAAVLLDMDGTLVDSDRAVERAWLAWAAEAGVAAETIAPHMHGNPAATTIGKVLPGLDPAGLELAAARQLELQYDDLDDVVPTPGAGRLLLALKELDLPWAVVTSADRRLAAARLGAAGIAPPLLVTFEDTPRGKPFPDPYLAAAAKLGVAPAGCLVVEDSQPGIDSGRAAGAAIAALRGLDGDLRLRDLGDLADALLSDAA